MYVGVIHDIKDMEATFSRGEKLGDPEQAPPGCTPLQFAPSLDKTTATCIWDAPSVDVVREYTDTTLGDASDQTYFEVDAEHAIGLPEKAAARA
jgi:hypothetical protein